MKTWEGVAVLMAVEKGFKEKDYPQFEVEARAALNRIGRKSQAENEANPEHIELGCKMIRTNRRALFEYCEQLERERNAKN